MNLSIKKISVLSLVSFCLFLSNCAIINAASDDWKDIHDAFLDDFQKGMQLDFPNHDIKNIIRLSDEKNSLASVFPEGDQNTVFYFEIVKDQKYLKEHTKDMSEMMRYRHPVLLYFPLQEKIGPLIAEKNEILTQKNQDSIGDKIHCDYKSDVHPKSIDRSQFEKIFIAKGKEHPSTNPQLEGINFQNAPKFLEKCKQEKTPMEQMSCSMSVSVFLGINEFFEKDYVIPIFQCEARNSAKVKKTPSEGIDMGESIQPKDSQKEAAPEAESKPKVDVDKPGSGNSTKEPKIEDKALETDESGNPGQ